MTVSSLQEYLAGVPDLPEDLFIGSLLFYRVSRCKVTRTQLEAWFLELGLDPRFVPNPIDPADAFLKATNRDNWRLSYPMGTNGMKANILIRDVKTDKDRIVKALQREVVDANAEKLHTATIGEIVYYKAPASRMRVTLDGSALASGEPEVLNPELDKLKGKYTDFCVHYDPQAIRMVLRDYVNALNAVLVNPSGGLYFVHKTRDVVLEKLAELTQRIGGDCLFELIPLINTPDKRDMLLEASQTATEKQCRELLEEIQRKATGRVSLAQWKKLRDDYQTILHRAEEYSTILGSAQDRAAMSLEAVTMAVANLFDKVPAA